MSDETAVAERLRESMLAVVQMKRDLEAAREELATARARLQDNDATGALRRLDSYFGVEPPAATPGPLPVARLDPVTVEACAREADAVCADYNERMNRFCKAGGLVTDAVYRGLSENWNGAAWVAQRVRSLAGQAVPVEVDPVEKCVLCSVGQHGTCMRRNRDYTCCCADRIRRAAIVADDLALSQGTAAGPGGAAPPEAKGTGMEPGQRCTLAAGHRADFPHEYYDDVERSWETDHTRILPRCPYVEPGPTKDGGKR